MREHQTDIFRQRERSLEEAFFKDRDQKLMEKMRRELEALEERNKLAHVTGIVEDRVLANLVAAGVRAEALTAVTLIPLVEVAWCDGSVAAEERDAVLNAAAGEGIKPDTAAYELLQSWLHQRPDLQVITAWKEYVQEASRLMPKDTIAELKKKMIGRCQRVAQAAGGFLGLATISKTEQSKIDDFAKAFDA